MTDSQWVNNQTTLIGNNSVNVNAGTNADSEGITTITGAVIASGSYETKEKLDENNNPVLDENGNKVYETIFNDNGNLQLSTNELSYTNLNDFFTSEQKGFGFGTSIGAGTDKGETNLHPQGQTTVSLQSTGEEKEQITKATIGNGTIIIGGNEINEANNNLDLIRDLNRDVNNSQEITKDMITGALNGSMTMDNRVFTEAGRNEIASDFENLPQNITVVLDAINPILVSRSKAVPPHPFPSLGIGDEVMGRSSIERDENNMPLEDKNGEYNYTGDTGLASDRNLLFRLIYALSPLGKSATDNHDIESNLVVKNMTEEWVKNGGNENDLELQIQINKKLATSIPSSFGSTFYGVLGTLIDAQNYSSNLEKIIKSYNNTVPKNAKINQPK